MLCLNYFSGWDFLDYHQNLSLLLNLLVLICSKTLAARVNSGVVIFLSWSWSIGLFSISVIFMS